MKDTLANLIQCLEAVHLNAIEKLTVVIDSHHVVVFMINKIKVIIMLH